MPNEENRDNKTVRERTIIRTSVLGIVANAILALFKAAVGLLSNSIAITLDAVNNLSDALSSVITIVGTKLAAKPADKKHPFGYGRLEYLSAMVISVIILYAGVTSFVESIKKIFQPALPEYSTPSLIILAAAVAVKVAMGLYVRSVGRRVNSDSLVASGQDALMDSIISATTIIAALVYIFTGLRLEAYLGVLISCMIIKAGFETMHGTISEILGERAAEGLAKDIKRTILQVEGVRGVYDLVLNNYGPDSFVASVHIEVDDDTTAVQIDKLQRRITELVYKEQHVLLAAIGVYPSNTGNSKASEIKQRVMQILSEHPEVLQMHGLYVDEEEETVRMDIIIDFDTKDRLALFEQIRKEIAARIPEYKTNVQLDLDVTAL